MDSPTTDQKSPLNRRSSAEDDGRAPPYERYDSKTPGRSMDAYERQTNPEGPPTWRWREAEARQRMFTAIVEDHVKPYLASNVSQGVCHTIFLLIPSDATNSTDYAPLHLVHKQASASIVYLHGEKSSISFWKQPKILAELTTTLRSNLSGGNLLPNSSTDNLPARTHQSKAPAPPSGRSWLRRKLGASDTDVDPTGSTGQWNLGWKSQAEDSMFEKELKRDEVVISAQMKDVAFRKETPLGLLSTETVKCVWVEIGIGLE